ncbi:hypothetical protein G9A89_006714 [Geosiphon pyriformis]|nr:hypothetical protein G9A89_006714 [Geosiphon pyriformis]
MNNHLYKNLSQYLETLQIDEEMPVKELIKLQKLAKHYFIQNHILYYRNRQNPDNPLRVITTDEKETILFNMHSDIHSGHFGKTATIQRNCKDSLREDPKQWVDFSSASEKEYINTHNNQELKNNLHRNSKKKAFSVTTATQHILNIATKKGKSHQYLGIFLSSDGLSKPSLAKVHSNVHFFSNLVLKKAVSDKQFLYLVLAVLYLIVSYRMQFSFIPVSVCNNNTIHHSSFYGLKSFLQCQFESKVASHISFANSCRILGQLFSHRFYDLQVLCWHPIHPLSSPARIRVSVSNNFLSGMVRILLGCNLSLGGSLASSFRFRDGVPISTVLGKSLFFKYLPSLWHYGIAFVDQLWDHHGDIFDWYTFKRWKKLDPRGPVPEWFRHSVVFLNGAPLSLLALGGVGPVDIHGSDDFVSVCDHLSRVSADSLSVYTDGLVKNLGMAGCRTGAAAFFEDINLGLGVCVQDLMLSTLAELQAVALALKCVPVDCSVCLFSDSQAALDACKLEVNLMYSDFRNRCWVECQHIRNIIHKKNLRVNWHKVKGHSGVLENDCADSIADAAALSVWLLSSHVDEHFLLADGGIVSGNSRHFVQDVFRAVCWACWEIGSGSGFLASNLHLDVDWLISSRVWHLDLHMATGFTSKHTADICTYLIKTLHHRLPVAVRKRIYDKCYPSVLCLYCGEVEVSDHMFSCIIDDAAHRQLLSTCASDFLVFSALCKGFVFKEWLQKAVSIFRNPKIAGIKIADFVHFICITFRDDIWLVCAKHRAYMEKNGLILVDGLVPASLSGLVSRFLNGVVRLLGVTEAFGIHFGFHKSCSFFSGIGNPVSVNIIV